jgi:uncharacterized protein with ParB-like and HNH nuclease domain
MTMNPLTNKIEAINKSISSLLKDQKFYIDYFQREYRWQGKHIRLLVEDLTTTFLKSYKADDRRSDVANYQSYYLGPVVFSVNSSNKKSIIDGQQRITSITLLLIYLNHLQAAKEQKVSIGELIFSEKYGEKSFNMTDDQREPCLKSLFEDGKYDVKESDDETVRNMVERYADIDQSFPEDLTDGALPYFIDWFTENVILVEIMAYSDENAYIIFETMNDRGLNLTPSEMLKGFVLSRITDTDKRNEINDIWKEQIQKLHEYGETADQSFFQAWFRGKYAMSIRPGQAGSEDKDFELIGSRFHNWFKDNHKSLFKLKSSNDFYTFFKDQFPFFVKRYVQICKAGESFDDKIPHLHYIHYWGIADSLQDPLMLAAVKFEDDADTVNKKIDFAARFVETFTVRRAVNYKKFGHSTIKYTIFNLIKAIRNNDVETLSKNLIKEIDDIEQKWEGIDEFGLHGQNRKFVKHLLCRISGYLDGLVGNPKDYASYQHPKGKQFEIEHIWADKFDYFKDEFDQEGDFQEWRNSIGALILLPNGTNQSFSSDKYKDKLKHYLKENTYAKTLHPDFYQKNPNFLKAPKIGDLDFKAHPEFKKADLEDRQELVQRICEQLWSTEYFEQE